MSDLTGHYKITSAAIRELRKETTTAKRLSVLPLSVVERDLKDVLCLGHWADFGQKHHFMRPFDASSPYDAFRAAVEWIKSNAIEAAQRLQWSNQHQAMNLGFGVSLGVYSTGTLGKHIPVIGSQPFASLGNAVHALEDSFAEGHVQRAPTGDSNQPGDIEHIKRYTGKEKEGHEKWDEAWWDAGTNDFSTTGWLAIHAVKDLLLVVCDSASATTQVMSLSGWPNFESKWLKASSKLSRVRDHAFELIDQFSTRVRLGNANLATIQIDEKGLAKALLKEPESIVLDVFQRLDKQFNSDADDVAEIYVLSVKQTHGPLEQMLKNNRALRELLIKVLDEGPTIGKEKACIEYLRSLASN
jgi:hypothetical protein